MSQSGNVVMAFTNFARWTGIGISRAVSVGNNNLGGVFTLGVSGVNTVVLPYNAPANPAEGVIGRQSEVQSLTLGGTSGGTFSPLFAGMGAALGTSEIQLLTFPATIADGTSFNLALAGVTASGITYSTTAATTVANIQAALDSTFGAGLFTVSSFNAVNYLITAAGGLANANLPQFITQGMNVSFFFGGTSLLIVVGVAMDTVQQVESQLIMRHYDGFMKKSRIRGRRA